MHFIMKERDSISVRQAISEFEKCRRPGIYKDHYINALFQYYNEPRYVLFGMELLHTRPRFLPTLFAARVRSLLQRNGTAMVCCLVMASCARTRSSGVSGYPSGYRRTCSSSDRRPSQPGVYCSGLFYCWWV